MSKNTTTPAPAPAPFYTVALVNITDGTVSGHKAGCADLKRGNLRKHADEVWELEVSSKMAAFADYNTDFIAEGGVDNGWPITWAACAKHVPETDAATEATLAEWDPNYTPAKVTAEGDTAAKPAKKAETKKAETKKAPAKPAAKKATETTKAAPAKRSDKEVKAARLAALDKAREARIAKAALPAPEVDGIKWQTSGKHGIVEGGTFLFHGDDKKAPVKRGQRLTMKIVDRVWITGLDSKGKEVMRAHIAKSFWAADAKAPKKAAASKKATAAKK